MILVPQIRYSWQGLRNVVILSAHHNCGELFLELIVENYFLDWLLFEQRSLMSEFGIVMIEHIMSVIKLLSVLLNVLPYYFISNIHV